MKSKQLIFTLVDMNSVFVHNKVRYARTGSMTARRTADDHESVFYPDEEVIQISGSLPTIPLIAVNGKPKIQMMSDGSVWADPAEAMKYYHPLADVLLVKE